MNTAIAENTNVQATAAAAEGNVTSIATHAANGKVQHFTLKDLGLPEVPAVVLRKAYTGDLYVFFADTQDKESGKLFAYDLAKGAKAGLLELPHAFYKTTQKLEDETQVKFVVQKLHKDLGLKEVFMRQRLKKDTVLQKDAEGKVDAPDVSAIKQQLKDELTNMFNMMMKKIDEAL